MRYSYVDAPGVAEQLRLRLRLCIFAYAYEYESRPLITDSAFDDLSRQIVPDMKTGVLDDFWGREFTADSGVWIRKHPDIPGIRQKYLQYVKRSNEYESNNS